MKGRRASALLITAIMVAGCSARGMKKEAVPVGESKMPRAAKDEGPSSSLDNKKLNPLQDVNGQTGSMSGRRRGRAQQAIEGGAYSETQRVKAKRGVEIELPASYGNVATQLDQALPGKPKIACVVVEQKSIRKASTRGLCKLLRARHPKQEIISLHDLRQSHQLNSLITTARADGVDLLVILEKRITRSFVILDTRSTVVLGQAAGSAEQVVPGEKSLLSLHASLKKLWMTQ